MATGTHPAIEANNLGLALFRRGMFQEAESSYHRALSLVPGGEYSEAHNNLGILYQTTNHLPHAVAAFRRSMQIADKSARPASNLASICEEIGRYDEAMKLYLFALQQEPTIGPVWHNLAGVYRELYRFDEAYRAYEKCIALDPTNATAHVSLVYCTDMDETKTPQERSAAKARWVKKHARKSKPCPIENPDPERKLRLGYLSGDFRLHSAAFAFADVLFGHDRSKFEVFCYSTTVREDESTYKFRVSVDHWNRIVGLTDEEAFAQIRKDKIDILVDMSGYTAGNRLQMLTMRPAPVQVHAWGYLNGIEVPQIPNILLDAVLDPENKAWHLPCVFHYRVPNAPEVNPLPALKNGHVTLGYLGRWSKVTPKVAAVWRDVMAAIPNAKLIVKDKTFADPTRRKAALERLGIPEHRVSLIEQNGHFNHLLDHNRLDFALDPWPTNGGVSSLECLWMGVPFVTWPGDRPSSRVGASLVTTAGLPDFVAADAADYVARARRIASDLPRLAAIRAGMRDRMRGTVLANAGLYVAHVERAYRAMWRARVGH